MWLVATGLHGATLKIHEAELSRGSHGSQSFRTDITRNLPWMWMTAEMPWRASQDKSEFQDSCRHLNKLVCSLKPSSIGQIRENVCETPRLKSSQIWGWAILILGDYEDQMLPQAISNSHIIHGHKTQPSSHSLPNCCGRRAHREFT